MANITSLIENNELVIKLSGRIDSGNSVQVEQDINEIVGKSDFEKIAIDAENLEYISSAGLRVVLRLRKNEPTLRIINVQTDVYEIFDMTGFVEMMQVEKAYRRISIDGCEVIGRGATSVVYRIDPDTIVKHYFRKDALDKIHRERILARKAFVLGIPTAIAYDVVKVEDGYGSVFELLNADTFVNLINKNPEKIDEYVDYSVEVLRKIHSTEVKPDEFSDIKDEQMQWAESAAKYLPANNAEKLLKLFKEIPESNKLLHGDCHMKNIMMQNGEVLLIDMDTLSRGNPIFEFSAIFNAYIAYSDLNKDNSMDFFGVPYETTVYLFKETLKKYLGTDDEAAFDLAYKKVALVGYTGMVCSFAEEDENSEATAHYIKKLNELIEEVDSLTF